jgi:hypothetical protein
MSCTRVIAALALCLTCMAAEYDMLPYLSRVFAGKMRYTVEVADAPPLASGGWMLIKIRGVAEADIANEEPSHVFATIESQGAFIAVQSQRYPNVIHLIDRKLILRNPLGQIMPAYAYEGPLGKMIKSLPSLQPPPGHFVALGTGDIPPTRRTETIKLPSDDRSLRDVLTEASLTATHSTLLWSLEVHQTWNELQIPSN